MDIELKYKIAEKIIQSDDDFLLNKIKELVGLSNGDFWDEVPDKIKRDIDKAIEQLDRGEGIPHSNVMAEIKARFINK